MNEGNEAQRTKIGESRGVCGKGEEDKDKVTFSKDTPRIRGYFTLDP